MQPAFVDKTIRCRGCQAPFRVAATPATTPREPQPPEPALPRSRGPAGPPASSSPVPPPVSRPLPTVFDDVGAVLGAILPGERVASVVRPRKLPPQRRTDSTAAATLVAILLGGACAVPVVFFILKRIAPEQYQELIRLLPPFLRFVTW